MIDVQAWLSEFDESLMGSKVQVEIVLDLRSERGQIDGALS